MPKAFKLSLALSSAILLLACGGEGSGGISASNGEQVLLRAGETGVVTGTLESVKYRLTNMSWSITPLVSESTVMVVQLETCQTAFTDDTPVANSATAVIHVDPTFPFDACF